MDPLIIGLDLGTTLCKATAFELDGNQRATSKTIVSTYRPQPGWVEQDPLEWITAITTVLSEVCRQLGTHARRVAAIGLSSHGPSLIATDDKYRPLEMAPIWQDQRAAHLCQELLDIAGNQWVGLGMPESSFAVKLFWTLRTRPELVERATYLFDVKGFLLATLTGQAVDETSSSPGGQGWNRSTYELLGVDFAKMPQTVSSITKIGKLLPGLADEIGLSREVVVVAGLNDGAAATLGAGVIKNGQGIVSLSTNGVLRTVVSDRVSGSTLVRNSLFCYSYVNDQFITGGTTKCGGDSVRWFIETFMGGYPEEVCFDLIANDAKSTLLGANGVIFMPYLMGMGSPQSRKESQGAFINLGRHHQRADMTRALLEGVAFSLRDIGEIFNHLNLLWDDLRFTGGGSKNSVWGQIVADVLDKPLTSVSADSVLGAAITAVVACEYISSIQTAVTEWIRPTFYIEPIKENVRRYAEIYQDFVHVRQNLDTLSISRYRGQN